MGSIRLGVGAEWLLEGRAYRVIRQLGPHELVAIDAQFQTERTFTEAELLALYAAGRLSFARPALDPAPENPKRRRPQLIFDLSAHEQRELDRRWQAIEPLTQLGRTPRRSDYRSRAGDLEPTDASYSPRSLQRFYRAWSRAEGDRLALVPLTARRGGRGRVRRHGMLGGNLQLRKLVDEAVTSVYLTTARRPIAAVVRRVLEDLPRRNAQVPREQTLPVPRVSALQRAISRRIAQIDPWERDRARWGRRIADRRHQPSRRQHLATRILQRVELDHSRLKTVVGNEAGPIGQPWLTVLIDYYSRMILGFCLGFEPPSYAVVMETLRQAILPKTQLQERYPQIQNDWPCYGIPEKIVCDRGADLTSKDLEDVAFQLGIELDFAPPRTPNFKGTVESFFDTLNDQLLSGLPGRTFRSWERRADHQVDDGPLMPYEALLQVVHTHLVDVYAQSQHPTLGKTRREVWEESAAEFPPGLPASPDDLVVLLSKRAERSLSARGIELGGMFYLSDELMALRAQLAAANFGMDQLSVRYNPWDLGRIWVLSPLDKQYLAVDAVDASMHGLTEYQWRVLKRAVRERFDQPEHLLTLAARRNALRDVVEAAVVKPSRKRRQRAARFLKKFSQAAPSPDSAEPRLALPTTASAPPAAEPLDDELEPLETELPQFEIEPAELDVDDWDVSCG